MLHPMKAMLPCLPLLLSSPTFTFELSIQKKLLKWDLLRRGWSARVAVVYHRWVRGRCLPLNGRTLPSKWWEVSPMCFSNLCDFIRWCLILFILTILLLKREQRFLDWLSNQAKLVWTCDLSQEIYLWSGDCAVFMAKGFSGRRNRNVRF